MSRLSVMPVTDAEWERHRETQSIVIVRTLVFLLVLAGSVTSAQEASHDVLISRQLATEQGLSVGSLVRLATDATGTGARTFRVAGIYEPTPDPARLGAVPREVRMHLPDLLDVTRPPGALAGTEYIANINVALADPADATAFARDVNARMPASSPGPRARRRAPQGPSVCSSAFISPSLSSPSSPRRCFCWR
jgi:hypothetical protein